MLPSSIDLGRNSPESAKNLVEEALKMVETSQSQEKKG